MLVDHERHYGLVTVCSWTTNVMMVWAWMHWSPCARGPRTSLWFGHGCTGHRVLVDHERTTNVIMVWARMHWSACARGPRTDYERYYGLSMDALVTVCSWTTNVIMVRAWMHWSPPAKVLACVGLQVVLRGEFRTAKFTQDLHD